MQIESAELIQVCYWRELLYFCASRGFSGPVDAEFAEMINRDCVVEACAFCDSGDGALVALQADLARCRPSGRDQFDQLRGEYTRLFIGPGKLPVPIWESAFVAGERLLFQKCTLEVREAYRDAGLKAKKYPHEPDDHVSTELAFMGELCCFAREAAEVGNYEIVFEMLSRQRRFLSEHLLRWIGEFSEGLGRQAGLSRFYPTLALLAQELCACDAKLTDELLSLLPG